MKNENAAGREAVRHRAWSRGAIRYALLPVLLVAACWSTYGLVAASAGTGATSGKVMVILGASYAQDWKADSLAGMRVVNKGLTGEETHKVLARFDSDVVSQKPQAVLLWGFINDIFRAPRADMPAVLTRTRANITAMVERARKHKITPILATEVTIRRPAGIVQTAQHFVGRLLGKTSYQDFVNGHVREVNAWMREYGREQGIQVLDFERLLADENGERAKQYAVDDGSHVSTAAYEQLAAYTESNLKQR